MSYNFLDGVSIGDKMATREGYGKALVELGQNNDFVVLDADLAEATKTVYFKKAYPDRFVDCGIAEQNMMGIAAGLASTGKTVFASSFAMFAAGRAFEQIRNSIAYPHFRVNICATHAGITVGEDGATHQCLEDIALMRAIPGMSIINPSDVVEAAYALEAALSLDGPCYMRFGRYAVPVLHSPENYTFTFGKGEMLNPGNDVAIIASGITVSMAMEAAAKLAENGISARVINIHTIKPLDREIVLDAAQECGALVTAEEHNVIGGLGSAVCETVCEELPVPVVRIGVRDSFGRSGNVPSLLEWAGITPKHIYDAAVKSVSLKADR